MAKFLWFFGGFMLALAALFVIALGPLQRSGVLTLRAPAAQPTPPSGESPATEVVPAPQPTADANRVLIWVRQSVPLPTCARLEIDNVLQAHYGPCQEGARLAPLTQTEQDLLRYYLLRYQPLEQVFSAEGGTVLETLTTITLRGDGQLTADVAHHAEIAQWAAQVYERLSTTERRADLAARTRSALAARLGVNTEAVQPLTVESVRWPDACLGLHEAGVFCAQVATPGYRLTLLVGNDIHEYRADDYGHLRAVGDFAPPYVLPPLGN